MKRTIIIILSIILSIVVGVGVGYGIYKINHKESDVKETKKSEKKKDVIYLGIFEKYVDGSDGIIISSKEIYEKYIHDEVDEKVDLDENNYVLITLSEDGCGERDVTLKSYTINDGVVKVKVSYEAACGLCAPRYKYYLIPVDKDLEVKKVDIDAKATNDVDCPRDVAWKPMIYIYPEKEMNVSVKLGYSDLLITTYPKYNKGWNVVAMPDGTLKYNGREYYGLYWEGKNHNIKVEEDGFVVKGEDVESFLEEKLSILGLNEREANEFIIYWLPKLEHNKYNYIRFETMDEINSYMPMEVNPKPDTVIRILMDYKVLDKKIDVKEQELTKQTRAGYTVVEWGGSEIK